MILTSSFESDINAFPVVTEQGQGLAFVANTFSLVQALPLKMLKTSSIKTNFFVRPLAMRHFTLSDTYPLRGADRF